MRPTLRLSPRRSRADVLAHDQFQQPLDLALLLGLGFDPVANGLLLGAHLVDQALDGLGEIGHHRGGGLIAAGFIDGRAQALDGAAYFAEPGGGDSRLGGLVVHRGGEPIFELGIETVLCLARLQIEKSEHQRSGKAEQGRRKRDAHAAERRRETLAQGVEHRGGVAGRLQPLDHAADRAHRLDQAPKRSEQPEEHQQTRHVTRNVACLVETGGDRIENAAHHLRRNRHPPDAAPQDPRHRRQQYRRPLDRKTGIGAAEMVHPADFRIKPQHLPDRQHDADDEHQDDQGVERRIGHERDLDLLVQQKDDHREQRDEHQHPEQEDARRRQLKRVDFYCHQLETKRRSPRSAAYYATDP